MEEKIFSYTGKKEKLKIAEDKLQEANKKFEQAEKSKS